MLYADCIVDCRHRMGDDPNAEVTVPASYSLIECPEIALNTRYRLLKAVPGEGDEVLLEERAAHSAPSLNLARIRHVGACLGASRVEIVANGD